MISALANDTGAMLVWALVAHLLGDYVFQSDWMARCKVKPRAGDQHGHGESWAAALAHGITYTLPFLLITLDPVALLLIGGTHIVIDHWRLARHVVWAKNFLAPRGANPPWRECKATGYPPATPVGLATALLIVADNTLHLVINTTTLLALS